MNQRARSLLALFALSTLSASVVACGSDSESSSSFKEAAPRAGQPGSNATPGQNNGQTPGPSTNGEANRAIAEADIIQLAGDRLYAMSKSGTLSIIDVTNPSRLQMLGQAYLPGEPFEMYLKGDLLLAMTNGTYSTTGAVNESRPPTNSGGGAVPEPVPAIDRTSGAAVIAINIKDPGLMQRITTYGVPGEIADSRMVGDVLYLATHEGSACYRCTGQLRTMVTSFSVATPTSINVVDQVAFVGNSGSPTWKRSVAATAERMYVGGYSTSPTGPGTAGNEGVIDVIDITEPSGKLVKGATLSTTGAIASRWQMDEHNGVLRVVSQRGMGSRTGYGAPKVEMFHIWNPRSFQLMGSTDIRMPAQEALKTVRFDGDRAYAITFRETDPLFVIDLADEQQPKQRGELMMPGWVFHIEPHGNRLLGLGLDRRDASGNLNVSLFDVTNMDRPSMIQRVSFGRTSGTQTDQQILSYELPEDQDRIQKAFRVLDNGLIVVPFSGGIASRGTASSCSFSGGIQLIDWQQDSLVKQSTLSMAGNPRRALLHKGALIGVSDSNVTAFDLTRREAAVQTADLTIGTCETRTASVAPPMPNDTAWRDGQRFEGDDWGGGHYACSATQGRTTNNSLFAGFGLFLAASLLRRKRTG